MSNSDNLSYNRDKHTDWNAVGKEYSDLDEARREIVFPFVREILNSIGSKAVLDYGCGDGRFLQESTGYLYLTQAVSYDPAPAMYHLAMSRSEGTQIHVVQTLQDVEKNSMEAITIIAVWMCLRTEQECQKMISEVGNLLKSNGHFIAAVTHPCFRSERFSTFKTDFHNDMYLSSGKQFSVTLNDGKRELVVHDTHWNLADMTRQLNEGGFTVQRIYELADKPDCGWPAWLIIHARKRCLKTS